MLVVVVLFNFCITLLQKSQEIFLYKSLLSSFIQLDGQVKEEVASSRKLIGFNFPKKKKKVIGRDLGIADCLVGPTFFFFF